MKIWVQENPPAALEIGHSPRAFLDRPEDDRFSLSTLVTLEGAEGKVLVDREALDVFLTRSRPNVDAECIWPGCRYMPEYPALGAEPAPTPHPHSGTCPLREPSP